MITHFQHQRSTFAYRVLSALIALTFLFSVIAPPTPVYAQLFPQGLANLPLPGTMVPLSPGFTPAMLTGITVHPENPLEFDFIIGSGDDRLQGEAFEQESTKLIKYFLAALTVPEGEMWVNLSPYEKDRVIPEGFGDTEMGRDLLAQDYILKQLTASLMYPEEELGEQFWNNVRAKTYEKFGTTEIPMNTFNKVWIVPDEAVVYEHGESAFVVKSHLKVMLEEDYRAMDFYQKSTAQSRVPARDVASSDPEMISGISSEVVREVLIPEIEKEVNRGETFANLRQIYNSVILATWYKQNLRNGLLDQVYVGKNKTAGVDTEDKQANQTIYDQYLEAFKKGVYNYIREDYDPATNEVIPRKYFSGGTNMADTARVTRTIQGSSPISGSDLTAVTQYISSPIQTKKVNWYALEYNNESGLTPDEVIDIAKPVRSSSPVGWEPSMLKDAYEGLQLYPQGWKEERFNKFVKMLQDHHDSAIKDIYYEYVGGAGHQIFTVVFSDPELVFKFNALARQASKDIEIDNYYEDHREYDRTRVLVMPDAIPLFIDALNTVSGGRLANTEIMFEARMVQSELASQNRQGVVEIKTPQEQREDARLAEKRVQDLRKSLGTSSPAAEAIAELVQPKKTSSPVNVQEFKSIIEEGKKRLNNFADQRIVETNLAIGKIEEAIASYFGQDAHIISDPTVFVSNKAAPMPIVLHKNRQGTVQPMHLDTTNNFITSEFNEQQGTVVAAALPLGVRLVNLTFELDQPTEDVAGVIAAIKQTLRFRNIDVRPLDATAGFLLEDELVVDESGISVIPYNSRTRINIYAWYREDPKVSVFAPLSDVPLEFVSGSLREGSKVDRPAQLRPKKVVINGARGRIGSLTAMQLIRDVDWSNLDLVGAFGTNAVSFANLLKVESVHGQTLLKDDDINFGQDEIGDYVEITIKGKGTKKIHTFNIRPPKGTEEKSAEMIPTEKFAEAFSALGGVDIVIDATAPIKYHHQLARYIEAGAKKVIKTAPSKQGSDGIIATPIVVGVNHDQIPAEIDVLDQASCTTGSTGSVYLAVLKELNAILLAGDLTSAHSSTGSNASVDKQERTSKKTTLYLNAQKATTGAAKALGPILPEVDGKIYANSVRLPLANGSMSISKLTLRLPQGEKLTAKSLNSKLRKASKSSHFKGAFAVGDTEISAAQIIGRGESAIVFAPGTRVQQLSEEDNLYLVTLLTWYDNEWGYTNRPIDLAHYLGEQIDQNEASSSPIEMNNDQLVTAIEYARNRLKALSAKAAILKEPTSQIHNNSEIIRVSYILDELLEFQNNPNAEYLSEQEKNKVAKYVVAVEKYGNQRAEVQEKYLRPLENYFILSKPQRTAVSSPVQENTPLWFTTEKEDMSKNGQYEIMAQIASINSETAHIYLIEQSNDFAGRNPDRHFAVPRMNGSLLDAEGVSSRIVHLLDTHQDDSEFEELKTIDQRFDYLQGKIIENFTNTSASSPVTQDGISEYPIDNTSGISDTFKYNASTGMYLGTDGKWHYLQRGQDGKTVSVNGRWIKTPVGLPQYGIKPFKTSSPVTIEDAITLLTKVPIETSYVDYINAYSMFEPDVKKRQLEISRDGYELVLTDIKNKKSVMRINFIEIRNAHRLLLTIIKAFSDQQYNSPQQYYRINSNGLSQIHEMLWELSSETSSPVEITLDRARNLTTKERTLIEQDEVSEESLFDLLDVLKEFEDRLYALAKRNGRLPRGSQNFLEGIIQDRLIIDSSIYRLMANEKRTATSSPIVHYADLTSIPEDQFDGRLFGVRVDYNVPLDDNGMILDDVRIRRSLETLRHITSRGGKVILTSHLGRPKGKVVKAMSLRPAAIRLQELLKGETVVYFPGKATAQEAQSEIVHMRNGEILVLENTRFHPAETILVDNEKALKKAKTYDEIEKARNEYDAAVRFHAEYGEALYAGVDYFALDGFSVAHRAHASVVGAPKGIPRYAGFLVQNELRNAERLKNAAVVVMGGAKADKISSMGDQLNRSELRHLLIGTATSNAFFKAQGIDIGASIGAGSEEVGLAEKLLKNPSFVEKASLPTDVVIASKFENAEDTEYKVIKVGEAVAQGWMIVDIGPETKSAYNRILKAIPEHETIFWNGPLGAIDKLSFAKNSDIFDGVTAFLGLGGGETGQVAEDLGIKYDFRSTAGGAFLENMTGKILPGIAQLQVAGTSSPVTDHSMENEYRTALQKARDNNQLPFDPESITLEEALLVIDPFLKGKAEPVPIIVWSVIAHHAENISGEILKTILPEVMAAKASALDFDMPETVPLQIAENQISNALFSSSAITSKSDTQAENRKESLPIANAKYPEASQDQRPSSPIRKILIIEDQESLRTVLREMVKHTFGDISIITAENGVAGLEAFQSHGDIDLILTDYQMPRMDGEEFAESVIQKRPDVPIILISGNPSNRVRTQDERGKFGGLFYQVLLKPLTLEQLADVKDAVDKSSSPVTERLVNRVAGLQSNLSALTNSWRLGTREKKDILDHLEVVLQPALSAVRLDIEVSKNLGDSERLETLGKDAEELQEQLKDAIHEFKEGLERRNSSSPAQDKVGGINLNPELLDLQIKRDGNGVPLPINLQPVRTMHIDGFVPIIINITPVVNLPLLLGFADSDSPVDSANTGSNQSASFDLSLADPYRNRYAREYSYADADNDL